MSDINDFKIYAELVKRVKAGDESAFAELYERSKKLVYTTCYAILNNKQDAEDAMQETYISVYNGIKDLTEEMAFLPWIKRIAANRSLDKYRARKDTASYDDIQESEVEGDADLETLPESLILEKDKRETFMGIMRDVLTADQLQATILFYYDEMPVKDIADSMKCPENTIKTKLRLARVKIKSGIEAYEKSNKVSLMGGAVGTLSLGRFFEEYYKGLKIPTPKDLPFKAAGGKALKAAGKASVKAASGLSGKTMGIIGASVCGIAVITGAVIWFNSMNKPKEPEPQSYASEQSVVMSTAETEPAATQTTETEPVKTKMTLEEAYLDILAVYGESILDFEETGYFDDYTGTAGADRSINFIDIDDDGVNELIFAYETHTENSLGVSRINLAIYTYSDDQGEAVCLLDRQLSEDILQFGWAEAAVMNTGNIVIADSNNWRMSNYERVTMYYLDRNNLQGEEVLVFQDSLSVGVPGGPRLLDYAEEDGRSMSVEDYINDYEAVKSGVVYPLIAVDYNCTGDDSWVYKRENSELAGAVSDKANYYSFNDFVSFLGGDPDTIFEPKCDWKALYLETIGSMDVNEYSEGHISNSADCSLYYELINVNGDKTPELAVMLSDKSSGESLMLIFAISDGSVTELYHEWYSPSQTHFIYYPEESMIETVTSTDNPGVTHNKFIGINSTCTEVSLTENYIESDVNLFLCPDYQSGVNSIVDGVYYHFWCNEEYEVTSRELEVFCRPDEKSDLNPSKTIEEITGELGN